MLQVVKLTMLWTFEEAEYFAKSGQAEILRMLFWTGIFNILANSGGTSNRKLEHLVTEASDLSARVQK